LNFVAGTKVLVPQGFLFVAFAILSILPLNFKCCFHYVKEWLHRFKSSTHDLKEWLHNLKHSTQYLKR
jgi:hypothetical protein